MSDEHDLALLLETTDHIELASVRSLLEGHGIKYVVQGELHSAMVNGFFGNPAIAPRVLVAKRDLEEAAELLKAEPIAETPTQAPLDLEGALCPVHEKQAVATCGRCGTFLCAECKPAPGPALCEDCAVLDDAAFEKSRAKGRLLRHFVVLCVLAMLAAFFLLEWS